jgi:cytoskeleton protein RodZ
MIDGDISAPVEAPRTAGAMLREARQAQGLHIAALSAMIKVAQRKLESLEADRLDELPDATFTRALAQTVCRALKIDPAPVLALLPQPASHRLEHVGEGLNEPFRDRPGRREPKDWSFFASPTVWGPALVILAAVAVYLLPNGWIERVQFGRLASPASAPSATSSVALPATVVSEPVVAPPPAAAASEAVESAPAAAPAVPAASVPVAAVAPPAGPLQLHTRAESWIEVHDARSRLLLSRHVLPGETVVLNGTLPFQVTIGNAAATDVVFRGATLDLARNTRDNVAKLELK